MSRKIITKIFDYAADAGADNLVIARRENKLILDCHFPGTEKQSLTIPEGPEQELFSCFRKMLAIAPKEFIAKKYCKLSHRAGWLNFYLTILPEANDEKIIINLIRKPAVLWRLNRLGFQKPELQELKKSLSLKSGLIIVSSPDGEGRSTTLNSLLLELSDSDKSVYCLEKYGAYEIPGIVSLEPTAANREKILKIDSEIIFAEDIDDASSLEYALRAAASGRLVFATMRANDSFEVVRQIAELELPRKLKSDSLKIIVNQRLAVLKRTPKNNLADERRQIGLFEILKITPALKIFLNEKPEHKFAAYRKELEKLALKEGFKTLAHDRLQKTREGLI